MSEWTPKTGDEVMVGDRLGPYLVTSVAVAARAAHLNTEVTAATWVPFDWLSPAPEPEPDEPTAPGALVRSAGRLWVRRDAKHDPWSCLTYGSRVQWRHLTGVTVVLADPAEVETLRAEVDGLREDMERVEARADELQRRINTALALTAPRDKLYDTWLTQGAILRGEQ